MSVLDLIRERGVVHVAVAFTPPPEEGHHPEFYRDPTTGEARGFVPELSHILAGDLGVEAAFVDIPWPEHLKALLDGRVDMLMSYTNTPERAFFVDFAGPLLPSRVMVLLPSGRVSQNLNEPGRRIGVAHGSSIRSVAERFLPRAELQEYEDPADEVDRGRIDGAVVDAVTKIYLERHPGLSLLRDAGGKAVVLGREFGHPAIRPGDPRFLNWLRNWLRYHDDQGTLSYWCDTWWQSFMAD